MLARVILGLLAAAAIVVVVGGLAGCAVVEKAINGAYDGICRSGTRDRC